MHLLMNNLKMSTSAHKSNILKGHLFSRLTLQSGRHRHIFGTNFYFDDFVIYDRVDGADNENASHLAHQWKTIDFC